jgi:hypothetical protein
MSSPKYQSATSEELTSLPANINMMTLGISDPIDSIEEVVYSPMEISQSANKWAMRSSCFPPKWH